MLVEYDNSKIKSGTNYAVAPFAQQNAVTRDSSLTEENESKMRTFEIIKCKVTQLPFRFPRESERRTEDSLNSRFASAAVKTATEKRLKKQENWLLRELAAHQITIQLP
jgi:hypothetical protein